MNYNDIAKRISSIRNLINDFLITELKKIGIENIAPSHGYILSNLYKNDGVSMKEITEKINKKKNTVTVLVNKLIKAGYIYKETDIKDRRITRIYLSEKGRSFETEFKRISEKMLDKIYNNFSDNEKENLIKLLLKIENNF